MIKKKERIRVKNLKDVLYVDVSDIIRTIEIGINLKNNNYYLFFVED